MGPAGEPTGDTPPMGERGDVEANRESGSSDTIAYSASAAAPPASARGRVDDDREVEFGTPYALSSDDTALAADGASERPPAAEAASRTSTRPAQRQAPTPNAGVPAVPTPLRTDDGRVVSVVHIVAELAPFARTGGLGEAV